MFRLGREYLDLSAHNSAFSHTVFLAATTHLAVEQLSLADGHFIVAENETDYFSSGWVAGRLAAIYRSARTGPAHFWLVSCSNGRSARLC